MLHTYEKLVKMILITASDVNFNGNHGNTHTLAAFFYQTDCSGLISSGSKPFIISKFTDVISG